MKKERINLLDLSFDGIKEWLKSQGEPASPADRIWKYIYRQLVSSCEEMTDLPASLRQKLAEHFTLLTLTPLLEMTSADGQTRKMLFRLNDDKTIEAALMLYGKSSARERRTVCVSTQVGCPVGCGFCATGRQGFERNLRPGEIVEQVLVFSRQKINITNVVLMGMGEPLANYDNVRQAVSLLNSPKGLGLGIRQITLSTVGLLPQMRKLSGDNLQCELAVSLHGATDQVRSRLVPISEKYPLAQLMEACKDYTEKTGRRIFFEYAIFAGINDSIENAHDLVRLVGDIPCSVNLIVGNPGSSPEFQPPSGERVLAFQKYLIDSGIRCMIRISRGADIEAGCGQLRSRAAVFKR